MQLTVAVVAGAHGLKGHVRLVLRTDDPGLRLQPGVVLDTDDPDLPELTLAEVRPGSWQVRFEEVSGRDAAEALRGTELSIETDEWESADDEWYDHELVGRPAHTPAGEMLGEVAAVEHGAAQDLLVVERDGRRALVPFVTAIVPTVDVAAGHLVLDPPGGLLDDLDGH